MTKHLLSVSRVSVFAAELLAASTSVAIAGAPFVTDDPGTNPEGTFELTISAQYTRTAGEADGRLVGVELNYGLTPALQLHLFQPLAFSRVSGSNTKFGNGDTELGVKYRFLDEREDGWLPSVAAFPLLLLPTGDEDRGLGSGHVRAFLPIWLGKSIGDWTGFGGGGYFINPGTDNRNFWFAGLGALRKISESLSLGAEIFNFTADTTGGSSSTSFNIGAVYSFAENHAIMLSAGRGLRNADETNRFSTFIGYRGVF